LKSCSVSGGDALMLLLLLMRRLLLSPPFRALRRFKMYECKINLFPNKDAEPPKEQVDGVLVFQFNASKRSASAGLSTAGVKRKLCSMEWSK
jgi:hypothetical protein